MKPPDAAELSDRILWLVRLRWLAAAGIVVVATVAKYGFRLGLEVVPVYSVAVAVVAYNAAFDVWARRARKRPDDSPGDPLPAVNIQIAADFLALITLLHFSGSIENPFLFYFVFHVIIVTILIPEREAYIVATAAVVLVGGLVTLEYFGLIDHVPVGGFLPAPLYNDPAFVTSTMAVFTSVIYVLTYIATSIMVKLRARDAEIRRMAYLLQERARFLTIAYDHLKETERRKSDFMRLVSHQLRAPVGAMQSSLRAILQGYAGEVPERLRPMLERSEGRLGSMLSLVDDLLTLSRAAEPPREQELHEVSLSEVVQKTVNLMRPRAAEKGLRLDVHIAPETPPVLATPEALEHVVTNLVDNAVRYTEPGGSVSVRLSPGGANQETVVLEVADTGIGIPPDDMPRVFQEFYRAENARGLAAEGSGLGLAIVKRIVESLHGNVAVQSEVNRGTTFRVKLSPAVRREGSA